MFFPKTWFAESKTSRRLSNLLKPGARAPRCTKRRMAHRSFRWGEQLEDRLLLTAVITTDKLAYAPTDPAILTGSDFQVGETIDLGVVRGDATAYPG